MTTDSVTVSRVTYARVAGFLYLIIIVCGIFSEVVVRSHLIVSGDASATASNILASQGLFRVGFAADSIMLLADVAIAVLFYVLLKPISQTLSLMAAAFRMTQAAVLGLNLLNQYIALLILDGSGYMESLTNEQLNSLALLSLDIHGHGYDLGLLFFAVSTVIMGYLLIKSSCFPRILGYGLIAAGIVYLAGSYVRFLVPDFVASFAPVYIVPLIAELSFCGWLLVKGGNSEHRAEAT